ncbi:hypothetical protein ACWGB8_17330 [Kitasatospora sp. NPDC054939]
MAVQHYGRPMVADPELTPTAQSNETLVPALLVERAGYVARGLADRVAQVDAELARLGCRPARGSQAHDGV